MFKAPFLVKSSIVKQIWFINLQKAEKINGLLCYLSYCPYIVLSLLPYKKPYNKTVRQLSFLPSGMLQIFLQKVKLQGNILHKARVYVFPHMARSKRCIRAKNHNFHARLYPPFAVLISQLLLKALRFLPESRLAVKSFTEGQ